MKRIARLLITLIFSSACSSSGELPVGGSAPGELPQREASPALVEEAVQEPESAQSAESAESTQSTQSAESEDLLLEEALAELGSMEDLLGGIGKGLEGFALRDQARESFERGDFAGAQELFEKSAELAREQGDLLILESAFESLASFYSGVGKVAEGEEVLLEMRALARERKDKRLEVKAERLLAGNYLVGGEIDSAGEALDRSEALVRTHQVDDSGTAAVLLSTLGLVAWTRGEEEAAVHYLERALAAEANPLLQAPVLMNLAYLQASLGQLDPAAGRIGRAEVIISALGQPVDRWLLAVAKAYVLYRGGRLGAAESQLRTALAEQETLWQGAGAADELRISWQDQVLATQELLQRILVSKKEWGAAWVAAEAGRHRAFAEVAARRHPDREPPPLLSLEEIRQLARVSGATLVSYSLVYDSAQLLAGGRLGGSQRHFEESLFIWVASPEGKVHFEEIELAPLREQDCPATLSQLIEESRMGLSRAGRGGRLLESKAAAGRERCPRGTLEDLARLLIHPVEKYFPEDPGARLIVVPQGELFLVPFPALPTRDGRALLEKVSSLQISPSLGILKWLPEARGYPAFEPEKVLVAGDPALAGALDLPPIPWSGKEAKIVAGIFGASALLGESATKSRIAEALPEARLIHLATHGLLEVTGVYQDRAFPGALALAPANPEDDGLLTAAEISKISLQGGSGRPLRLRYRRRAPHRRRSRGAFPGLPSGRRGRRPGEPLAGGRPGHQPLHGSLLPTSRLRQRWPSSPSRGHGNDPKDSSESQILGRLLLRWRAAPEFPRGPSMKRFSRVITVFLWTAAAGILAGISCAEEVSAKFEEASVRGGKLLPREFRQLQGFDPEKGAGLFVGVGNFSKDHQVTRIPYAVDDAVDLAHLFSLELGLIAPQKVRLFLAGEPVKEESRRRLEALVAKRARVEGASIAEVLVALDESTRTTTEEGFLVVTFATHGLTFEEEHYLMAEESNSRFISKTGLETEKVFGLISKIPSERRLVLVDACRQNLFIDRAAGSPDEESKLSKAFLDALSEAEGQVILTAAREGEYAYDDKTLRNGVFSRAVLDGLRCGARSDRKGLIRSRSLCRFVSERVRSWTLERKKDVRKPGIECRYGGAGDSLPLSLCRLLESRVGELFSNANRVSAEVRMALRGQVLSMERRIEVGEEIEDSLIFVSSRRRFYKKMFRAEPGFQIARANFVPSSENGAQDVHVDVLEEGRVAMLRFNLRSGPDVDQYSGWLRGRLILSQEKRIPGRIKVIPVELKSSRLGSYRLASAGQMDSGLVESVSIVDEQGFLFAHGSIGETLLSPDRRFEIVVRKKGAELVLDLHRRLGNAEE